MTTLGAGELENGAHDGQSIVPQSLAPAPLGHLFRSNLLTFGKILLLALAHRRGHALVTEQNIVLIIQFKTAAIHIGRTDQRDFTIYGKGFCM